MKELLVATTNAGKFSEIMEVLDGLPFEFLFLKNLGIESGDFEEDGETFRENAFKKAKYFHDKTGFLTLAEDSGIKIAALDGELGVKTRRWGAGEHASDQEWIDHFMRRMADEKNRDASFVCSACVYGPGVEEYFEGETKGVITEALMAPILTGLPLSSCFLPEGSKEVYAALGAEKKNEISHRGKAIGGVRSFLETKRFS